MAGSPSIGDLTFRLVADSAGLLKDVEVEGGKAGDKAATTFTQRFGAAVKKGIGVAAAGAFALVTKGALDLDDATRRAAASMGLAESELAALRSQVASLFAANPTKGFGEIADTIAALKTDLGLSADEAGKAAQAFLDFSKVTGQDGVSAVKGLDDVLDAWNLDATESQRIMDLLVAGHQKYGGSVTENQAALAKLAPQLQALNVGVDDGAALLNLFASTGLDASQATFALNTAVRNLKPGENLNDLIARISAIEDPTLRAQAAIEVFGARGGVALANALRPGIDSLDDFKVRSEDAAGATSKAADVIDNSWSNRIVSAIRSVTGPLVEVGAAMGPILTSVAALNALGAFALLKGGIVAVANLLLTRIVPAISITSLEMTAFEAKGVTSIGRLRTELMSLIPILGLITFALTNEEGKEIRELGDELVETYHRAREAADATSVSVQDAARAWGEQERAATESAARTADAAERQAASVISHYDEMRIQALWSSGKTAEALPGALSDAMPDVEAESAQAAIQLPEAIEAEIGRVEQGGYDTVDAFIDAIESGREDFIDAWTEFENAQKNSLSTQERLGRLGGLLQTKALAKGIDDARPDVRGRARAVVLEALNQLIALGGPAGLAGTAAGQRFATSFGAGAGMMDAEFQPAAVSTKQLLDSLNGAFAAGGIAITEYDGDLDALRRDMLGLGADTDRATGATKRKTGADKDAAKAAREAEQAEKDRVNTLKGRLADALRTAKDAALDYFRRIHDKNLEAIRDTRDRTYAEIEESRKRIRAHLDEVRATEMAPVTEAERAQRAIEDAQRLRDLQDGVAEAQERLNEAMASGDQGAVESAQRSLRGQQEALASFEAQRAIEALRATAEANIAVAESEAQVEEDALDTRKATADALYEQQVEAENERYDEQVKAFGREWDLLTKHLTDTKTAHADAQAEIAALYKKYAIDAEAAGELFGAKYAAGLLASKKAVEGAAEELAKAIEDFLKTHSPARRGPLHRTSPEEMGASIGSQFGQALLAPVQRALDRLRAPSAPAFPFAGIAAPHIAAPALGSFGGFGSQTVNQGARHLNVTVNNPTPEPAGISIRRRLGWVAANLNADG